MEDERVFIYKIDAENNIVSVNDEWLEFGIENGSPDLTASSVLGKNILSFIADLETIGIFTELIELVREKGCPITIRFRCDAPATERSMEMKISALPAGHIEFRNRMLKAKERPPVAILDSSLPRTRTPLTLCSWCKSAHTAFGWLPLEDTINIMGYLDTEKMPLLTHGICPSCEADLLKTIKTYKDKLEI